MINAPRVDFVNFRVPIHVSLDKFFWTRNPTIIVSLINNTRNDVRLFAGSRRWITLENINYVRRQIVRGALHILLYNYGNEQRYLYRFENDATAVQIKICWIVFFHIFIATAWPFYFRMQMRACTCYFINNVRRLLRHTLWIRSHSRPHALSLWNIISGANRIRSIVKTSPMPILDPLQKAFLLVPIMEEKKRECNNK